jgi:hypothetical protein
MKMINFIKNNQKYFTIGGACILLLLTAQQRSQIKELKSQQFIQGGDIQKANIIDSLESELFVQQKIVARYEMTLELLKEEDKKAADKFELILTTETE